MHLAADKRALLKMTVYVADDDLSLGDLIIGRPVLKHLCVDTRTLLEQNRSALDGTDCSDVYGPAAGGHLGTVGRLMTARLERQGSADDCKDRPQEIFFANCSGEDPFPKPSSLDPIDKDQEAGVQEAVDQMLVRAADNRLPVEHKAIGKDRAEEYGYFPYVILCRIVSQYGAPQYRTDVGRPTSSAVRVKLRNYSTDQRDSLKRVVGDRIRCGMVYLNPIAAWAYAPLLIAKPGLARFRFTVDLGRVNRSTIKHWYQMPIVEKHIQQTAGSNAYALIDLPHGYWQFPLHDESQDCLSFITSDGIYTTT